MLSVGRKNAKRPLTFFTRLAGSQRLVDQYCSGLEQVDDESATLAPGLFGQATSTQPSTLLYKLPDIILIKKALKHRMLM
jgi:hypothetical protein